ncbi:MAG: hypothetical protein ACR2KG_11655 [Nocardioidaceae bacterium]
MLDTEVRVPTDALRYRIDYDTTRSSPDFTLSTQTHTQWGVSAGAPRGSLPAGWVCSYRSPSTDCHVLALMTSNYQLPVDQLGRIPSGTTKGAVTIGHLQGLTAIAVTSLRMQTSFDNGQTWQPVRVNGVGGGRFEVTFTVPPSSHTNGFGSLRLSARDAVGGTFQQTIQRAFAVTGA